MTYRRILLPLVCCWAVCGSAVASDFDIVISEIHYHPLGDNSGVREFVELFEDVIVAQWADRFTEYSGQKFEIVESTPAQSVRSEERVTLVRSLFNCVTPGPEH